MNAGELQGAVLDAWVAVAQGHRDVSVVWHHGRRECRSVRPGSSSAFCYRPSSDWLAAGPVLEQAHIRLRDMEGCRREPTFEAMLQHNGVTWFAEGELPLIAAMRVYVRSRFSEDELEAPLFE